MFPIQQPVAIFLLVLLIILLGPMLFRPLKIPPIVGMIIAGIAVGPYGFNLLERDASFRIFGEVGILYIMFLAAVEIDMFHMRQSSRKGLIFGILSFLLPMTGGIMGSHYAFGTGWLSSVLIASMYASHTLISYPIVSRFGLSNNRSAVIAVCGTIVAVLLALMALAGVVQIKATGVFRIGGILWLLMLMAVFMTVVGYSFPWLTRRVFSRNNEPATQFIFILALVFVASLFAHLIGLEAILGAFYAGLVLNPMIPSRSALMKNIKFVGDSIFIPYFLIGVGMLINVGVIFNGWTVLWVAVNMTGVALFTKWLACFIMGKALRMPGDEINLMFGLTSGKAAATIAATMIGFKYGLVTEDVMNGAVMMILICCLVSSVVTERAVKRIKIRVTQEDLNNDELKPGELARQIVAVANPFTAEELMRLALFMRSPQNHNPVTALFVRNNDDPRVKATGREALTAACAMSEEMDVEVKGVERFDINIVTGLTNVSHEENATEMVIGLHRKSNIVDTFYGPVIEGLLHETNKMLMISRCFLPVDTVGRIIVAVPEKAEYETGFSMWVMRMANLGAQVDARLIFLAYPETQDYIRQLIVEGRYEVRHDYRMVNCWDDFIVQSGDVNDDDLMVMVSARKGSLSYSSDLENIPPYLSRHFSRHNLLVIYPKQF